MCAGESRGALEARIPGSTSPASGVRRQIRNPSRARGKGRESKGLPEGADSGGRVAGGCRAERSGISGGVLRAPKGQIARSWASRAGAPGTPQSPPCFRRASLHLPALFLRQARRAPLGEMPAHAESGALKKRDKTPGGSGASFKGEQSRLLRDLRVDTKSRWTRLLQENPTRKKPNTKKGSSKGCFGQKLDRIGALSGLGC